MTRTLLLADGSVTIQRVMELTFAHENIRVMSAPDGRRAIQLLESEQPDIVLADVDLPEVDGYALAAHIRRVPRLKDVPVLLLAGAFEPIDQARAREVGSDGVITKPFEPQVVINRVRELIEQRDRMAAPAPARGAAGQDSQAPLRPAAVVPAAAAEPVKPQLVDPAYPRQAAPDAAQAPPALVIPEPLELPTRPVWDARGSVAHGEPPAAPPIPFQPVAAAPTLTPMPAAPPKVTLANAFTALLAAEQSNQPASAPAPAVSEASIEDAVRRVLVRMTDDLVRRIVVDTAERLIREEIERIKANPD